MQCCGAPKNPRLALFVLLKVSILPGAAAGSTNALLAEPKFVILPRAKAPYSPSDPAVAPLCNVFDTVVILDVLLHVAFTSGKLPPAHTSLPVMWTYGALAITTHASSLVRAPPHWSLGSITSERQSREPGGRLLPMVTVSVTSVGVVFGAKVRGQPVPGPTYPGSEVRAPFC